MYYKLNQIKTMENFKPTEAIPTIETETNQNMLINGESLDSAIMDILSGPEGIVSTSNSMEAKNIASQLLEKFPNEIKGITEKDQTEAERLSKLDSQEDQILMQKINREKNILKLKELISKLNESKTEVAKEAMSGKDLIWEAILNEQNLQPKESADNFFKNSFMGLLLNKFPNADKEYESKNEEERKQYLKNLMSGLK